MSISKDTHDQAIQEKTIKEETNNEAAGIEAVQEGGGLNVVNTEDSRDNRNKKRKGKEEKDTGGVGESDISTEDELENKDEERGTSSGDNKRRDKREGKGKEGEDTGGIGESDISTEDELENKDGERGTSSGDNKRRDKKEGKGKEEKNGGDGESEISTDDEFEYKTEEWKFGSEDDPKDDNIISPPLTFRQLSHLQADTCSSPKPRKLEASHSQKRKLPWLDSSKIPKTSQDRPQGRQIPCLDPSETSIPLQKRARNEEAAKTSPLIFQDMAFCWSYPLHYKFKLTILDFFPANQFGPRELRIRRAIENGAVWIKDFHKNVTHVIAEKEFPYQEILRCLGVSALPVRLNLHLRRIPAYLYQTQTILVNEDYLSDCIGRQNLLDPTSPRYRIQGSPGEDQSGENNNKVWEGNYEAPTMVQMLLEIINGHRTWDAAEFEKLVQEYGTQVIPLPELPYQRPDALDDTITEVRDTMATASIILPLLKLLLMFNIATEVHEKRPNHPEVHEYLRGRIRDCQQVEG